MRDACRPGFQGPAFARAAAVVVLASAVALAGCASQQDTIRQQKEKLQSLAASAQLLADDALGGQVSQTYAETAFDALFRQVEQQRAVLAARPKTLIDPQAAALSQQAEQLSRLLAQMQDAVARGDAAALGSRRATIPLAPDRP